MTKILFLKILLSVSSHEFLLGALEAIGDVVCGLVLGDGVLRYSGHRRVKREMLRFVTENDLVIHSRFMLTGDYDTGTEYRSMVLQSDLRQYSNSPKEERRPAP